MFFASNSYTECMYRDEHVWAPIENHTTNGVRITWFQSGRISSRIVSRSWSTDVVRSRARVPPFQ